MKKEKHQIPVSKLDDPECKRDTRRAYTSRQTRTQNRAPDRHQSCGHARWQSRGN